MYGIRLEINLLGLFIDPLERFFELLIFRPLLRKFKCKGRDAKMERKLMTGIDHICFLGKISVWTINHCQKLFNSEGNASSKPDKPKTLAAELVEKAENIRPAPSEDKDKTLNSCPFNEFYKYQN
jgi:hypothetical protein